MQLWDKRRVVRLCRDMALLALAMICSYLEFLLPIGVLIPLPGVKLGLANVVITAIFFLQSPVDAAVVSLLRVLLSALLFGNPVSLLLSLSGALFAFLSMLAIKRLFPRRVSMIGVSVLAATGHHIGQILAAALLFDLGVMLAYLPLLLLAGVLTGGLTGLLLNLCYDRLERCFVLENVKKDK